jgi:hypothetical protein
MKSSPTSKVKLLNKSENRVGAAAGVVGKMISSLCQQSDSGVLAQIT